MRDFFLLCTKISFVRGVGGVHVYSCAKISCKRGRGGVQASIFSLVGVQEKVCYVFC